ncbi:N-acetylglucosamine kinase [Streptomyces abyssomicinicus]|uniref:N-acetylglucosamine kinase n=1 Tax=Streptomyces abyssomicinicus TaxID=574929 RepID=UPI001FE36B9A|nr:BadF/BadG/BcrA/BcrD ATPase family protein [Streptomyces abyssomicinicus]
MSGTGPRDRVLLAVDSGGSGLRVAVGTARSGPVVRRSGREPVRTGARGLDPRHLTELLAPLARAALAEAGHRAPDAVAVGAAGFASLGDAWRAELPDALTREFGGGRDAWAGTVLASDAVTAYVGALGFRPGAVVAAGTGLTATGTDLSAWRRADGWGHLLGDCGSGAWIGRAGLEAALRAHDGRPGGSAALLERGEALLGPAAGWPQALYPRTDRSAVLASFAPEVAACAQADPVAEEILREAARHMAGAAAAACPDLGEPVVSVTGGLVRLGDPLLAPLREELAKAVPHARQVPPEGDPLTGAFRLARGLALGDPALPPDPRLLCVTPGRAAGPGDGGGGRDGTGRDPATGTHG